VANQQWAMGEHAGASRNVSRALAISETLHAAQPNNVEVLRELTGEYGLAGDLHLPPPAGEVNGLSQYFRKAVKVDEEILRIVPDDLFAGDEYAIDLFRLGWAVEDEDPDAAKGYYTKELEIELGLRQRSSDTRYARGVAHSYGDIARVYEKEGKYSLSLENYSKNLTLIKELIQIDPQNTLIQQSLAVAYINTAVQASKAGSKEQSMEFTRKSLEIMRRIVAAAPENKKQLGMLADVTVAAASNFLRLDRPKDAMREFEDARGIYESLHTAASTAGPSLESVACEEKMGEAAARFGNSVLAAEYFHHALAELEPILSTQDPALAALYSAADAYSGLGDVEFREATLAGQSGQGQKEHWAQAHSWYLKSLAAWSKIKKPSSDSPNGFDAGDPTKVAKRLHSCEVALAR
jgi:tetratricopeptide (TPR) repeat protein